MGKGVKNRRFLGDRDQESRLRCNYSNNYHYFFSMVFAGSSGFCKKMGKWRVVFFIVFFCLFVCLFFFFNVLRPRAKMSILNVFKGSFNSR